MRTLSAKPHEVERRWYVVDLKDQVLGRAASRIASILRGKHKPIYTPHVDTGDFVVVINAADVRLTGDKWASKKYYRHSGYVGGIKTTTADKLRETKPEDLIVHAVRRMIPRNPLGRKVMKKLKVYPGAEHPHEAQRPEPLPLENLN